MGGTDTHPHARDTPTRPHPHSHANERARAPTERMPRCLTTTHDQNHADTRHHTHYRHDIHDITRHTINFPRFCTFSRLLSHIFPHFPTFSQIKHINTHISPLKQYKSPATLPTQVISPKSLASLAQTATWLGITWVYRLMTHISPKHISTLISAHYTTLNDI